MATVDPVRGGERLEKYLNDLAKKLGKSGTLRVGFLSDAVYPDGTQVAEVAAIQNFGAPAANIPARPFFSNMVNREAGGWGVKLANILKRNDGDLEKALGLMGEVIAGQLRQSIVDTNAPPLAPATIRAKGFDKALVDTGNMIQSIGYEVEIDE